MTDQTTEQKPTDNLKSALTKRRLRLEQEVMEGEIEAQPATNQEMSLVRMEAALAQMLPQSLAKDPDKARKMLNNIIQLVRKTPKLALCGDTIMGGVLTAGQLGLELGVDALGEAYLLPFKKRYLDPEDRKWKDKYEATLIIGYKGYRKLCWQSGKIKSISRGTVYANDFFEYERGTDEYLRHRALPPKDGDRGPVIGYYATVANIYGGTMWTFMYLEEVEAHRDAYAMAKKVDYNTKQVTVVGPWADNFNEMALKTVLLKTLRESPLSIEDKMAVAMHVDGSIRRNTDDLSDSTDIIQAAILPQPFNANGVNVIEEDDAQEEPPAEEPPAQEPPAPQQEAPAPATDEQKAAIRAHADKLGENDYDLFLQSLVGRKGIQLERLTEVQAGLVITQLNEQEK